MSIGEAATLSCVLLRTRCRVYRGRCDVAVSIEEAATPSSFFAAKTLPCL